MMLSLAVVSAAPLSLALDSLYLRRCTEGRDRGKDKRRRVTWSLKFMLQKSRQRKRKAIARRERTQEETGCDKPDTTRGHAIQLPKMQLFFAICGIDSTSSASLLLHVLLLLLLHSIPLLHPPVSLPRVVCLLQ
jgi:hypothetical protein